MGLQGCICLGPIPGPLKHKLLRAPPHWISRRSKIGETKEEQPHSPPCWLALDPLAKETPHFSCPSPPPPLTSEHCPWGRPGERAARLPTVTRALSEQAQVLLPGTPASCPPLRLAWEPRLVPGLPAVSIATQPGHSQPSSSSPASQGRFKTNSPLTHPRASPQLIRASKEGAAP